MKTPELTGLEVAVIGYSGRFNTCGTAEEYWEKLSKGEETFSDFSVAALEKLGVPASLYEDAHYVRRNGHLTDKDCFDAAFFGYTPAEATLMDPQIRIFHEIVWSALEASGYTPGKTNKRIGLYASANNNNLWQTLTQLYSNGINPFTIDHLANRDFLCTLIAYHLNLKGPAVFVHTACSSSLVAVHQAVRAVLTGDCEMAIAGGIGVSLLNTGGYTYQENLIFSPDGHCRAFDAQAGGTVVGEGGGAVVLKRYQDAVRDGDTIHAIIKGSAINNDGKDKAGFTAPGVNGHRQVIKDALRLAKVAPETVSYIEAHGTGTKLGDPVEFKALSSVYGNAGLKATAIGSVKTNIGHLDAAAGIASLIKVILMLKHRQIPESLHFKTPNAAIGYQHSSLYVNTALSEWESGYAKLRAGVSSLGIGGTNCHIIVEEPFPMETDPQEEDTGFIIHLSAKAPKALSLLRRQLADHLSRHKTVNLADLSYTLLCGRDDFKERLALRVKSKEELTEKLMADDHLLPRKTDPGKGCVFMFSGQGAQYASMSRDLYTNIPAFQRHMDSCFELMEKLLDVQLKPVLFPGKDGSPEEIDQTFYTQLCLFATCYSLARLLTDLGIVPTALIGHSVGEYAGMVISGMLSLSDGIQIVGKRAALMQRLEGGKMYAVFAGEEALRNTLMEGVSIAAVNAPNSIVISGSDLATERLVSQLKEKGIACKKLRTSHAFHSAMMEPALPEFTSFSNGITCRKPDIPLISNLTGAYLEDMAPGYFGQHLRSTVRFERGINTLLQDGHSTFIEVGPGKQLTGLITGIVNDSRKLLTINVLKGKESHGDDRRHLMDALSSLWAAGLKIDWTKIYEGKKVKRILLPTYPFEKVRFPVTEEWNRILKGNGRDMGIVSSGTDETERYLFNLDWEEQALTTGECNPPDTAGKQVLLFCDNNGYADRLMTHPSWQTVSFITVRSGAGYHKEGTASYTIDPAVYQDYLSLLSAIKQDNGRIAAIVHCCSLDILPADLAHLQTSLSLGYLSLVHISRSLEKCGFYDPLMLNVVTNGAVSVGAGDAVNPVKATIVGALKIISAEHDNLRCKLVDMGEDNTADLLCQEIFGGSKRLIVAYRNRKRFLQHVVRAAVPTGKELVFKQKGCYLITGGIGGMGLAIARDIALNEKAAVVLVTRRQLPPESEWDAYISTHGMTDGTAAALHEITAMKASGAAISLVSADVGNYDQMETAVAQIKKTYGDIHGLIWAAGVIDEGGVILKRQEEQFIEPVRSKAHGVLIMEQLIDFKKLDFIALFSSSGNLYYKEKFGQIGYNVANEFLSAYARCYAHYGNIVAIDWCDWKQVGMSVKAIRNQLHKFNNTEATVTEINNMLEDGLYPPEALAVFRKCITAGGSNYVISTKDLAVEFDMGAYESTGHLGGSSQQSAIVTFYERPDLKTAYVAPSTRLQQQLIDFLSALFGINNIGIEDDFFELGGDSLKAIQYINQIEKELKIKVRLDEFLENPTIGLLADIISNRQIKY